MLIGCFCVLTLQSVSVALELNELINLINHGDQSCGDQQRPIGAIGATVRTRVSTIVSRERQRERERHAHITRYATIRHCTVAKRRRSF